MTFSESQLTFKNCVSRQNWGTDGHSCNLLILHGIPKSHAQCVACG